MLVRVEGSDAAVPLGAWLEARLRAEGLDARLTTVRPRSDGVLVTFRGDGSESLGRAATAIARSLLGRVDVTRDAAALGEARLRLAALDSAPRAEPRAHARCRGDAVRRSGAPKASAPTDGPGELGTLAASVEALRTAGTHVDRVAFGVAGRQEVERSVLRALRESGPWLSPSGATNPSPDEPTSEPVRSAPGPARGLQLSIEVPFGARAANAARALTGPTSPLARLAAREGATVTHVTASARVDASCIDVALAFPEGRDAHEPRVLPLLGLVEGALTRALVEAEDTLANVSSEDASRHAAFFAATATSSSKATVPTTTRSLLAGTPPSFYSLPSPGPRPHNEVLVEARTSSTANDAWVLLAAPCAASDESSTDAGLAAVAIAAAATANGPYEDHASLAPWISPHGIGLIARGPARPNESAQDHVTRLTRMAAVALAAPAPTSSLEAARTRALTHAASDSSRLLAALAETLAPGRLPMLVPGGSTASLTLASDDALRARAIALAEGPLVAHVVSKVPAEEATRLARAVFSTYVLGSEGACRIFTPKAPPSARINVVALAPRPGANHIAIVFVDENARPAAIIATIAESLRDGTLAKELGERGHDLKIEIAPFGSSSALVVHFVSAREKTIEAISTVRSFLARVGSRLPEDTFRRAAELAATKDGPDPSPVPWPARPTSPPPAVSFVDTKNAANALFASGGIVGVSGAP